MKYQDIIKWLEGAISLSSRRTNEGYLGETVLVWASYLKIVKHEMKSMNNRIKELENSLKNIEEYVDGLVRVHCQFAEAAKGSWSGKKQRVRAAEASLILAFIRKQKIREGN